MSSGRLTVPEKLSLLKLIFKFKINTEAMRRSPISTNLAWSKIAKEYNLQEGNSRKSETQLRRYYDKLMFRKRSFMLAIKQQSMNANRGNQSNEPGTSNEVPSANNSTQQSDAHLTMETDGENREGQAEGSNSNNYESPQTSNENSQSDENTSNEVPQPKFRNEVQMEETILKLTVKRHEWLLKAAEEEYLSKKIQKEAAKEMYKCNMVRREEAELSLRKHKINIHSTTCL